MWAGRGCLAIDITLRLDGLSLSRKQFKHVKVVLGMGRGILNVVVILFRTHIQVCFENVY